MLFEKYRFFKYFVDSLSSHPPKISLEIYVNDIDSC